MTDRTGGRDDSRDDSRDDVEALADDVARLLRSVRDVASEQRHWGEAVRAVVAGHPATTSAPGARAGAGAGPGPATEHPSCRACPVCQGLDVLRETRPEAYDHLARAVSAAADALRVLLAPSRPAPGSDYSPGPRPGTGPDRPAPAAGPAGGAQTTDHPDHPDHAARPEPAVAQRIDIDEGVQ